MKKNRFVFLLSEKLAARKVYLADSSIYKIISKNSNDKFKRKYNRFVTETSDSGTVAKLRERFNNIQAASFYINPPPLSKMFSYISTPTPKITKYGSILDVGCSSGIFLQYLPNEWKVKKGIEISERACVLARRKGIDVKNTTLENFKTKDKFYFIRASHVIEHVTDYNLFLKKAYLLLQPGGKLIIYTPNSGSLTKKIFNKYWEGFYDATHFTIFNLDNLSLSAKEIGFKVVNKKTYDIGYWPASIIRRLNLAESAIRDIIFWFLLIIFYPSGMITRSLNLGDALFIELKK